jgi:hypothetical protein
MKDGRVQINLQVIHRANQAVQIHPEEEKTFQREVVLPQGLELPAKQGTAQTHVGQGLRQWNGNSQDCVHEFLNPIFRRM